jgi:hypothetical protein
MVFMVKVSSLQQELEQSEFTVYASSSLWNDWNYMCLCNLICTKNATCYTHANNSNHCEVMRRLKP